MTLSDFLVSKGYSLAKNLPLNGETHRFSREGDPLKTPAWFKGSLVLGFETASFGDWSVPEKFEYSQDVPAEKREAFTTEKARLDAEAAERKRLRQEKVALEEQNVWAEAIPFGNTPYLKAKGLLGSLGAKIDSTHPDTLLIPVRDIDGKLWACQRISGGGAKSFTAGGRKQGCFCLLGEIFPKGDIYVCEGYATARSVFEALGGTSPVVAGFDVGNIGEVGRTLRGSFPLVRIIYCADNDRKKTGHNPGVWGATAGATAVGGEIRVPIFPSGTAPSNSDFNDLHALCGLQAVREQLLTSPSHLTPAFPDLTPLPWGTRKRGAPIPPDPQRVADALLEFYGPRILKQEDDFFLYTGTHWKLLDTGGKDLIRRQLQYLFSNRGTAGQVEGFYSLFKTCLRSAPVDMFAPRATLVNFLDGTLHLSRGPDFGWRQDFKPHAAEDYLLNCIPLHYERARGAENKPFHEMLGRVFAGDPDSGEKIRAVRQMYGACLAPFKPHLFLLHGPMGSGKSSLIIPAMRLVHQDNWCSVQPHEFRGFLMESMLGKLVNFRTDISTTEPIADDTVKMIEDRVPIRVDRKFKTAIYAPPPAVHVFGANSIPPTLDGGSGAHTRRWTFIRVAVHKTEPGKYLQDFGHWVFEQGPEGVLAFALEGLSDILQGGHYVTPASGVVSMREWQLDHDPIGRFLDEVRQGKLLGEHSQLMGCDGVHIKTTQLWEAFKVFHLEAFNWPCRVKKFRFYARIQEAGFNRITVQGAEYFAGIGVREAQGGKY